MAPAREPWLGYSPNLQVTAPVRKNTGAVVAYPDPSVDDVAPTVYFLGAEDELRGSVRGEPAVDRGGAYNQYSTRVDPQAARYVRSAKDAKLAGVDDYTSGDRAGQRDPMLLVLGRVAVVRPGAAGHA